MLIPSSSLLTSTNSRGDGSVSELTLAPAKNYNMIEDIQINLSNIQYDMYCH